MQCALKYGEAEVEGCLIDVKLDTLIPMVALTDVDLCVEPGQSRVGHLVFHEVFGLVLKCYCLF